MNHRSEHSGITLVVLALVILACVWLYLYTESPADLRTSSTLATSEVPELLQGAGRWEIPESHITTHAAGPRGADPVENRRRPLDYGGGWGIVSSDLVEAGRISAADAKILNEATIRFEGSTVQTSAAQVRD